MARSSPSSELSSELLPTFGRPMIATRTGRVVDRRRQLPRAHPRLDRSGELANLGLVVELVGAACARARLRRLGRQRPDDHVQQVGHAPSVQRADGVGLLPAQGVELGRLELALLVVGLVGGHDHRRAWTCAAARWPPGRRASGRPRRRPRTRSRPPRRWPAAPAPGRFSSIASPGRVSSPPVSMTTKRRPFHSPTSYSRSRVVRARSSTMATRSPTTRLNSVLLPTLGRPTKATTGSPSRGASAMRPASGACRGAAPRLRPRRRRRVRGLRPALLVDRRAAIGRLRDLGQGLVRERRRVRALRVRAGQLVDALRRPSRGPRWALTCRP